MKILHGKVFIGHLAGWGKTEEEFTSDNLAEVKVGFCRSLIKVNYFTDQVRPALGSGGCLVGCL